MSFYDPRLRHYSISDSEGRSVRFHRASPEMTSQETIELTDHKFETIERLREAGVPTPESRLIDTTATSLAELTSAAETLGYPVVLKRLDGLMGQGVFTNITSAVELEKRYHTLKENQRLKEILLEPHVTGDDYRVLIIDGEIVGACLRLPANVVGDGVHTIDELIRLKNDQRKSNPFLSKGLIRKDIEVRDYVEAAGMTFQSVPAVGRHIRLRGAANGSAGGDLVDATETLTSEARQAALDAVAAVPDLYCCGVDVLFDPATRNATILELNAVPAIGTNMYPSEGAGQDVPKAMIDKSFPKTARSADERDRDLYFPMRPIRELLRTGLTESVTVAPIPSHRFSFRRRYRIDGATTMSPRQLSSIQRAARRMEIAGHIKVDESGYTLMAAGSEQAVRAFVHRTSRLVGVSPSGEEEWDRAIPLGFHVN